MTDTRILRNAGLLKENMGATPLSQLGALLNSIQKEYEALKAYERKTRMEPPPGQVQSLVKGLTAAASIIKSLDADDSAKKDGIDLVNDAIESIEMELSPEGAINQLLDMMRRARFTGSDTYDFTVAEEYGYALAEKDYGELKDDEAATLQSWLDSRKLPPGGHWEIVDGSLNDFARDEVSGLGAKTVDVVYIFPKKVQGQAPLGETPIDGEDNPQPKQRRVLPKRPKKNPQDDLIKGAYKELDRQIAANAEKSMRTPQK